MKMTLSNNNNKEQMLIKTYQMIIINRKLKLLPFRGM